MDLPLSLIVFAIGALLFIHGIRNPRPAGKTDVIAPEPREDAGTIDTRSAVAATAASDAGK